MKARVQFDGDNSSHLVDQSFIKGGYASGPGKAGDRVAIIKGKNVGCTGSIDRFTDQMLYVTLSDGSCPRVCQSSVVCIKSQPAIATARPVSPVVYPYTRTGSAPACGGPAAVARSPPRLSHTGARSSTPRAAVHRDVRDTRAAPAAARYRTVSPTPSYSDDEGRDCQKFRVGFNKDDHDVEVLFRVSPSSREKKQHEQSSSHQRRTGPVKSSSRTIRISLEY
jgi:hypothetical protein